MNDKEASPAEESRTEQVVAVNGFSAGAFIVSIGAALMTLFVPAIGIPMAILALILAAFGLPHKDGRWMAGVGFALALGNIVYWCFIYGGLVLYNVSRAA